MCGISGAITKGVLPPDLKAAVARMSTAQVHRGPDGGGEYSSDKVALASRRLSIIDVNGGHQPLYSEDGSLVLVINGEIYNYVELRAALKAAGHKFRTETDGEVILHLYQKNPSDFIRHLRGMFAFALYDTRRRRVILARDRMGEKPLYLFESRDQILFASEMKGLLSSGLVPFELDANAVNLYFHYQYVPEPLTAVKGVRKLDAATMLVIDTEEWKLEETKYWTMTDAPPIEAEPSKILSEKLQEVSKLTVRSDVRVGVALSGGLDSSLVAALASRHNSDLCAFTVGYEGRPESDERSDALKLARHLDIPFHEAELRTQTIVDLFPELNFWRDDPIADIAGFGYYAVMRLAREHSVPVILQGQGGDELFWGYPQLHAAARENVSKAALRNGRTQGVSAWLRNLGGRRSALKTDPAAPAKLSFYDKSDDFNIAASQSAQLYGPEFAAELNAESVYSPFEFGGDWDYANIALTERVCATYLRENGITQGDRLGMASSVEMRLPLVDHEFVETVIGLRKAHSDVGLAPKYWLAQAASGFLPDWVLTRPKRGFAPPTQVWHRALFSTYGASLRDGFLVQSGVLTPTAADRLSEGSFPAGENCPLSFKALVLEQWCRQMQNVKPELAR